MPGSSPNRHLESGVEPGNEVAKTFSSECWSAASRMVIRRRDVLVDPPYFMYCYK